MLASDGAAIPIAGGTDLLVHWPVRVDAHDRTYVDLSRLDALKPLSWTTDELVLGGLTTYWDVSREHRQRLPRRRRRAGPHGLRRGGGARVTARPGESPAGPFLFRIQGDAASSRPAGRGDPDPAPSLFLSGVREGRWAAGPGDREGRFGRHPFRRRLARGGGERRAHHPPLSRGRAIARDRHADRVPGSALARHRSGRRSHRRRPLERALPHARDGAPAVSRPAGLLGKAGVTPTRRVAT